MRIWGPALNSFPATLENNLILQWVVQENPGNMKRFSDICETTYSREKIIHSNADNERYRLSNSRCISSFIKDIIVLLCGDIFYFTNEHLL